jgi:segregation and condensation protein B
VIEQMIRDLAAEYDSENRSFRIQEIAGGFEVGTDPKYAPWIMKLEMQKRARQASHSALETLAIIAYKQPVTRSEAEDLRGVDIASVLAALLEKNLIKIVGRKEVPGRPFLYGTTEKFLEHFGLKALSDLPQVGEIRELVEKALPREKFLNPKQEENELKKENATENPDVQAIESPDAVAGPGETAPEDRPA